MAQRTPDRISTSITPSAQRSLNAKIALGNSGRLEHRRCGGGTLAFGQAARQGQLGQLSRPRGPTVAAAAFRGAGRATAVEIQDATMAEAEQVVHGQDSACDVVTTHRVDTTNPPSHGHDGYLTG